MEVTMTQESLNSNYKNHNRNAEEEPGELKAKSSKILKVLVMKLVS